MNFGQMLFAQLMDFLPRSTIQPNRLALWRRPGGPDAILRHPISCDGIRATDLPGEPARH
jgi:hypothetical protein